MQAVTLAGELKADHLLGVGALAGVAQRALVLGEGCRQPGDVGLTTWSS